MIFNLELFRITMQACHVLNKKIFLFEHELTKTCHYKVFAFESFFLRYLIYVGIFAGPLKCIFSKLF